MFRATTRERTIARQVLIGLSGRRLAFAGAIAFASVSAYLWTGNVNWIFLLVYGALMVLISPTTMNARAFFQGAERREVGGALLTASVLITWIFAKSITNAANLGNAFGLVGGLAYSAYYLSFFVAAFVIYRLRVRGGFRSVHHFLSTRYGLAASLAFTLAILIRLMNEIWSNTAVVAAYFGPQGSSPYLLSVLVVTAFTVYYTAKGGLRSSILTDGVQMALAAFMLFFILGLIFPGLRAERTAIVEASVFSLRNGVDLLLVALLQVLSYPFHDPVLTDRGFVSKPRAMRKAFLTAGGLGVVFIFLFSLVGVHARVLGLEGTPTIAIANNLGLPMLILMNVIMLSSATSTIDSTFSSVSKLFAVDLRRLLPRRIDAIVDRLSRLSSAAMGKDGKLIGFGRWIIVAVAVAGNLPLLLKPEILSATTISGTMVMGLAPIFLLYRLKGANKVSFHLSFWTGVMLGILLTLGWIPQLFAIGAGRYGLLLGTNLYGLGLCTTLFLGPTLWKRLAGRHVTT
ncbi:MAG: sodium:solute symporter [Candidatus Bipolaricaulia bacterium]